MAEIALTKQAVARRLLIAAVRLAVEDGDSLAILLIASSALKILRDLLKGRGPNYVDLNLAYGLFAAAKLRIKGEPDPFPMDISTSEFVDQLAAMIKSGDISSASDIKMSGSSNEYLFFEKINSTYNFLKHADKDPFDIVYQNDVYFIEAVVHCVTAYFYLFPNDRLDQWIIDFVQDNVEVLRPR